MDIQRHPRLEPLVQLLHRREIVAVHRLGTCPEQIEEAAGEGLRLPIGGNTGEALSVRGSDDVAAERVPNLRLQAQQHQPRIDIRGTLADLRRNRVRRDERISGHQPFVRFGLLEWMHVLALQVLDDGGFAGGLIIEGDHVRRDRGDFRESACA